MQTIEFLAEMNIYMLCHFDQLEKSHVMKNEISRYPSKW
jgi:hypothetical protein